MKKIYFFLCMILCSTGVWAQTLGDYRSAATGNWNANGTWERFDGTSWVAAVATPASTDGVITIRSPHVVTISASGLSYDQVVVDAGAQVTVAPTITGTLANGTGTDLTINGTWLNTGSTWTVTGTLAVGAGGTYIHSTTSAIAAPLGQATLDPASNFIYRGSSTLTPAFSLAGRTYGNLSFESTSGTMTLSGTGGTALTINGNLNVASNVTVTIGMTGTPGHAIKGNITVASGSTLNLSPASAGTMNFNGGAAQSISNSGTLTMAANEAVVIANTNGVTFNNNQTVSGTMTVNAGSVLATSGTLTLTGSPAINGSFKLNQGGSETGGTMTYGAASTLIYGGTATQTASPSEFPAANGPASVSLDNSAGVNLPASFSRTIGNLNLNNGVLALGNNNLTISSVVNGGSPTSYIKTDGTGAVTVNNISAETLVPLGNAKYNPLTIQNGSGHNWAVRVEDGLVADPGFPTDKAILVTWNVTPSVNPPAGPANLIFQFDETTQAGASFNSAENVQAWYRTAFWNAAGSPASAVGVVGAKKVTVSGLTHFSPYAISNISGPLPISIDYFNGAKQGADHLLSWKVNCNSTPSATMILERSSDGRNYKEIYSINATATRCQQPFEYTSAQPLAGINYYRLKMLDANGKMSYSSTVALLNKQSGFELVSIAPNPVQSDGRAILNITAAEAGSLQIVVTDMNGSKLMTQTEALQAGSKQVTMNLNRLAKGTYQVSAYYSDGTKKTLRFVKQ